jgi:hypothetical protein
MICRTVRLSLKTCMYFLSLSNLVIFKNFSRITFYLPELEVHNPEFYIDSRLESLKAVRNEIV